MLNVAFIDAIGWDYDAGTPYERPLGGSQSALCYLTAALAQRGHQVTLVTSTRRPGQVRGVNCLSLETMGPAFLGQPFDAVVVLNGPADLCLQIRGSLKPGTPPVAARFEAFCGGIELANGFHELADAREQRQRFLADNERRRAGGQHVPPLDEDLLNALASLPDCAGVALGFDRLVALATSQDGVAGAVSFAHR